MERASVEIWNWIEGLSTDKQKHLLQWQLQAREQIHSFKDVRLGDHLVRKDSFLGLVRYEHHFICVGLNGEGKPLIVHYYNTPWKATAQLIPTIIPPILPPARKGADKTLSMTSLINSFLVFMTIPSFHFCLADLISL